MATLMIMPNPLATCAADWVCRRPRRRHTGLASSRCARPSPSLRRKGAHLCRCNSTLCPEASASALMKGALMLMRGVLACARGVVAPVRRAIRKLPLRFELGGPILGHTPVLSPTQGVGPRASERRAPKRPPFRRPPGTKRRQQRSAGRALQRRLRLRRIRLGDAHKTHTCTRMYMHGHAITHLRMLAFGQASTKAPMWTTTKRSRSKTN